MTLEHLAYLAEVIGVILIVISLIYLARQLKQNTDMLRLAAAEQGVQRDFDIVSPLFENREFAEVWCKGGENFEELDEVDQQRLILFERRPIMWWHHGFQLRQQGLVPDADWRAIRRAVQKFGRRRAVREAWLIFREDFDEEFKSFMEEQFETGDRL